MSPARSATRTTQHTWTMAGPGRAPNAAASPPSPASVIILLLPFILLLSPPRFASAAGGPAFRDDSIGPPAATLPCANLADCAGTPFFSACEDGACVLHVRSSSFGEPDAFEVVPAMGFDDGPYRFRHYKASAGMLVIEKLDNAELDIAALGSTPAASAVARGANFTFLRVQHTKGGSQSLCVKDGINNAQDLVGKTVATPCGSTAHYALLYFLQQTKLSGQVNVRCAGPGEIALLWDKPIGDPDWIDGGFVCKC